MDKKIGLFHSHLERYKVVDAGYIPV